MTATPGAGVVNDYLILQYAKLIFGLLPDRLGLSSSISDHPALLRAVHAAIAVASIGGPRALSATKAATPRQSNTR
jgi:hypothetical protein